MDQECRGFIEKVNDIPSLSTPEPSVHYLSNHPIKKDSQITPIWIVYDCSCHESSSAASLNDCLEVVPPLLIEFCYIFIYAIMHCQQTLKRPFFMSDCTKTTEISLVFVANTT